MQTGVDPARAAGYGPLEHDYQQIGVHATVQRASLEGSGMGSLADLM